MARAIPPALPPATSIPEEHILTMPRRNYFFGCLGSKKPISIPILQGDAPSE